MLGIDRRAARAAWTVFLVVLLLVVVYYVRTIMLVFVLAILFAYLLSPIVNLVDRFLPWPGSRTYSLAVVYTLLIGLLVLAGVLVGNRVAQEAATLEGRFPELQKTVLQRLHEPWTPWLEPVRQQILDRAQGLGSVAGQLVRQTSTYILSILSSLAFIVLIPILGFFFLKDGHILREQFLGLMEPDRRAIWEDILSDVHALLGRFIRALVILALAVFAVNAIFFTSIGLPYGLLLATMAGALEVIPIVGPLAAALLIIMVAVLSGYGHVLVILAFLAAYRIFQDYILNPHLMSSGVEMHPLLVIFGALAGAELAGIPGMFLSVPVMATLRVVYARVRKARR